MSAQESPEAVSPAYIPFKTFANFVERLKSTAVPDHIDNSVMPTLAVQVRGQVRSALRFLGLTKADNGKTDSVLTTFRTLVQAHGTESWGSVLNGVIDAAYANVLNGLDLRNTTPSQLNNKFKAVGMSGQMLDKAIRFLLAAFDSAGRPYSPHLAVRNPSPSPRRTPKAKAKDVEPEIEEEENNGGSPPIPPGTKIRKFTFPVPGEADIQVVVSEGLNDLDAWGMVDATLRSYIGLNKKAQGRAVGQGGGQQ